MRNIRGTRILSGKKREYEAERRKRVNLKLIPEMIKTIIVIISIKWRT